MSYVTDVWDAELDVVLTVLRYSKEKPDNATIINSIARLPPCTKDIQAMRRLCIRGDRALLDELPPAPFDYHPDEMEGYIAELLARTIHSTLGTSEVLTAAWDALKQRKLWWESELALIGERASIVSSIVSRGHRLTGDWDFTSEVVRDRIEQLDHHIVRVDRWIAELGS